MKNRDGLENNDHWATPRKFYNELNDEFHFDFDPCPLHHNLDLWDGLKIDWGRSNFINCPYNRFIKPQFIQKAFIEWQKGKTCVLLLPTATGTKQFHELILPYAEIRFVKGRIAFEGYNTKNEFTSTHKGKSDSMLIIYRAEKYENYKDIIPK